MSRMSHRIDRTYKGFSDIIGLFLLFMATITLIYGLVIVIHSRMDNAFYIFLSMLFAWASYEAFRYGRK